MVRAARLCLALAALVGSNAASAQPDDTMVTAALLTMQRHALFQPRIDDLTAAATAALTIKAPLPARCNKPVADVQALIARITCATAAMPAESQADARLYAIKAVLRRFDRRNDLILPNNPLLHPVDPATGAGIGLVLEQDGPSIRVRRTLASSPARAAGISPGDHLTTLDGKAQEGRAVAAVAADLAGPAGSRLVLGLTGPAGMRSLSLTRVAPGPALNDFGSWQKGGVLWIEMGELAEDAPDRIRAALAAAPTGIVIDLRDNSGGALDTALAVAGLFLPTTATVADIIGHDPTDISRHKGSAAPDSPAARVPMAVLVNGGTASGAEIIAAALADNRRARLVGSRTYGLGTIQSLIGISRDHYLRLTTHQVRRANGFYMVGARVEPSCQPGPDWQATALLLASGAPCPPAQTNVPAPSPKD